MISHSLIRKALYLGLIISYKKKTGKVYCSSTPPSDFKKASLHLLNDEGIRKAVKDAGGQNLDRYESGGVQSTKQKDLRVVKIANLLQEAGFDVEQPTGDPGE